MADTKPSAQVHYMTPPPDDDIPPPGDDDVAAFLSSTQEPGESAAAPEGGKGKRKRPPKQPPQANVAHLHNLFKDFAYEYGTDVAWDTVRRMPIKISHLRHTFGNSAVKIWMASEKRRVVYAEEIAFEPGQELPAHHINLFAGLPAQPVEGDCSVMLELLRHLCADSTAPGLGPEEIADWVLRWCALPLQRIGAKLDTALVFHGPQGTGKNLFFDVLRDLYGEYGVMVGQTEIEDKYNTWLSRRMLIIGDEVVSRQEMYHVKNRLKWIVTQRTKIPIRAMHMDTRWESNHANLVFLSNESQPLALEGGDRRFCVIYTPTAERGDLYARVAAFLKAGGAAKFLHFLQNLDLGDFTESTKPPLTSAKQSLIELGLRPAERFMHEWLQGYLPLPMRVCSVEQLYKAYTRWATAAGERWPGSQSQFTEQAKRFALDRVDFDANGVVLDPVLRLKVLQLRQGEGRKAVRCWLPRGTAPPEGVTEGEWGATAIEKFEDTLRGFMRRDEIEEVAP